MSRSVSAPSSVTNTSPCWNGLIVPGSTFRYGSNFWSCTRRPRAFKSRPSDAATMPFPSAETTPPVTKMYFVSRALTGFKGSSAGGRRWSRFLSRSQERVQPAERATRKRALQADKPWSVDDERHLGPRLLGGSQGKLRVDAIAGELERDPLLRHDVENHECPGGQRAAQVARLVRPDDLPAGTRRKPATVGLHPGDPRPPVGKVVRLGEKRPHVVERREQDPVGRVPGQNSNADRRQKLLAA